jgi:hypothetical protein
MKRGVLKCVGNLLIYCYTRYQNAVSDCMCIYDIITNIHERFEVVNTKVLTVVVSQSKIYGLYSAVNINRTTQTT